MLTTTNRFTNLIPLFLIIIASILTMPIDILADDGVGIIRGTVRDISNQEPVIGASIQISGASMGAASDTEGNYVITKIPAGVYVLTFGCVGYSPASQTDIVVRPGRITYVNAGLEQAAIEVNAIKVTPGLFDAVTEAPGSNQAFNAEEIRRAPGSAGDISRLLKALPSQSQVADNVNDLMVRGGSPFENAFYIDGIRVQNINHFPAFGTTGGPIGMLNTDFIDDTRFSAGGFPAQYGGVLSSVTEIDYREGNREEFDAQVDLSMAGFGGVAEGPLAKNGSYMFSARKSYLDLISDAIGAGGIPRYGDIQGKASYDISPSHHIDLLNIYGESRFKDPKDNALENDQPYYGDYISHQNTLGLSWRYLWGKKGYSTTSLSFAYGDGDFEYDNTATDTLFAANKYTEKAARLRNINHYQPFSQLAVQFGLDGEYDYNDVNYRFGPVRDRLGNYQPAVDIPRNFDASKGGAFAQLTYQVLPSLSVTAGVRGDYFSESKKTTWAPRGSVNFKATDRLSFHGAAGVYYQELPYAILSQNQAFLEMPGVRADHYVIGSDYMLWSDTRLTIEAYHKGYSNCPIDPADPTKFVLDDGSSLTQFRSYPSLVTSGKARSHGLELTLQKKLAQKLYGLVGGSISRSEYRDLNGTWRPRSFDNRYIFSIIGGYRPNKKWETSFRWNYAGGVPYTPFDLEQSRQYRVGIIDQSKINGARYSAYHTLNLQLNRRFMFSHSNIVIYASALNVYNRKNVAAVYWNEIDNKPDKVLQWTFLPVLGVEYEF